MNPSLPRMTAARAAWLTTGLIILGTSGTWFTSGSATGDNMSTPKESKFFSVDMQALRIVKPLDRVVGALKLDLVSVTVDQPQYWPNEQVYLKVLLPGRPQAAFTATYGKRDAGTRKLEGQTDAWGVAVLELLDGARQRLEVGEYRVDLKTADGAAAGSATFSVVEGTLGALSLAHEFKKVTSAAELDRVPGGWFMGNAAGAGSRWGNGLSFKNELRAGNQPYSGPVTYVSRCMLPGCNGVAAGPERQATVKDGKVWGTMDVGGHSGPFQIEFITPKGSLRHQFEGSSHVERDMVPVSGGVSYLHRAGLAPYEQTEQVPGRQIFIERTAGSQDAYAVESVIARNGRVVVEVRQAVAHASLVVWTPRPDGKFDQRVELADQAWKAGRRLEVAVGLPYSFLAMGGFVGKEFREGWALAFPPGELRVQVTAPAAGGPQQTVAVELQATLGQQGVAVAGILEVFDNRIASRSPLAPLGSAIGDSFRNASSSFASWQDRTGIEKEAERRKAKLARDEEDGMMYEMAAPAPAMAPAPPPPPSPRPAMAMKKMAMGPGGGGAQGRGRAAGGPPEGPEDREAPSEPVREGEQKVVFCGRIETDAAGRARVEVTLPPQLGRVTLRFAAIRGLDHGETQQNLDVQKKAAAELQLPRALVPGARLQVPVQVDNGLDGPVTLEASGAGLTEPFRRALPARSRQELLLPVATPAQGGQLTLTLSDGQGRVLDRRQVPVGSVGSQPVTFSRLEVGGGTVAVAADETAVVYRSAGELLKGTVQNMVTTMDSWFGHAEALSARAAASAVILAAIERGLLADEGLGQTLRTQLETSVRHLSETFFDPQTGLVRPYPGLQPSVPWSAWVARNLHVTIKTLKGSARLAEAQRTTIDRAVAMVGGIDAALARQKLSLEEAGGYHGQGEEVIPIEVEGQVVMVVPTDRAVTRWAADRLLPVVAPAERPWELDFSAAYDRFRFFRAFERVGLLGYLAQVARGLVASGDTAQLNNLLRRLTRGMIFAQEPGMLQGPALLGGVYSTPMALIRFLELLIDLDRLPRPAGVNPVELTAGQTRRTVELGEPITVKQAGTLRVPAGLVVRVDRKATLALAETQGAAIRVQVTARELSVAGETVLTVELDPQRDPLEYYALIAVPSTTAVKQTEDILSDSRGQLIYGQQALGSTKLQFLAVPFRGKRNLTLFLEGVYRGESPGLVVVRHLENPADVAGVAIPVVRVK